MDWTDRVALITGASSGIGEVTARKLAGEGLKVVLVARREDRLNALAEEIRQAGGQALVVAADLTQDEARQHVYRRAREAYGQVDVLVNNAGLGWYGYSADMPWQKARQIVQVNVEAVVHFTLLFLPEMRARDDGHVINVGSIAGSLPSQGVAIYCATKSFVDSFTTALYREMQGTNVRVSVIRPGAVSTDFFDNSSTHGLRLPAEKLSIRPEAVANCVWSLLRRPRRVAYVPAVLWFVPWVEMYLGWLFDLLGPLLLRKRPSQSGA